MRVKLDHQKTPVFNTTIEVTIGDINYGNHMGNDRFLTLMQEARLRWLQSLGFKNEKEIAASGGGIWDTVTNTRKASQDELEVDTSDRLTKLLERGITTVEVKSGYGLSVDEEIKMLQAINIAGKKHQIDATMVTLGEDQTYTAMAKTVGLPVAIATLAILNEKINSDIF